MRGAVLVALAGVVGCSAKPSGTLQIVTGGETDTFTRSPAPVKLRVDVVDTGGTSRTLATTSLPAANIDLGSMDFGGTGTLEITGTDANGNRLVYGQSIQLLFGSLDGITLPLFVQRVGELARLPNPLSDTRREPTLTVLASRYLFVGAGADPTLATTIQLYDLANLAPLSNLAKVTRAPLSAAFVGTLLWLIDGNGATQYDVSKGTFADVTQASGGTFAEVAGGATVGATDGTQYVVGATRTTGEPTARVLAIASSGSASWLTLSAPRLGATATYVAGRGLVVAGGSATAAGVEVVGAGSSLGAPLAYGPDATTGAGAAALDTQHVLLAGGMNGSTDAGVRLIDLACVSGCAATAWTPLATALSFAQVFPIDPADALVVGSEPTTAATHVFRANSGQVVEIKTKVAHTGARAVASPIGPAGSALVFGGAGEIESFTP